jgi:hypothetical protein
MQYCLGKQDQIGSNTIVLKMAPHKTMHIGGTDAREEWASGDREERLCREAGDSIYQRERPLKRRKVGKPSKADVPGQIVLKPTAGDTPGADLDDKRQREQCILFIGKGVPRSSFEGLGSNGLSTSFYNH